MGYIPPGAKWYLGDIVEQITVQDDPRSVIHVNTVLIRADSPEEAYEKAVEVGASRQTSYQNPEDKLVTITYRGLQDLNVIHDDLEHGAELIYRANIETDGAEIQKYVCGKEQLGVFAPRKVSKGPNYASKDVLKEMNKLMGRTQMPCPIDRRGIVG